MKITRTVIPVVAAVLAVAACTSSKKSDQSPSDPGRCVVVDVATSPEKGDLMTSLAKSFNGTDKAELGKDCVFVRSQNKSSGAAAQLLSSNWDENVNGPRPVVWSPAATSWGLIVN
jgi:Ca-activated chloride channel homolog